MSTPTYGSTLRGSALSPVLAIATPPSLPVIAENPITNITLPMPPAQTNSIIIPSTISTPVESK